MGKVSKDVYVTGIFAIIAAIVGAWCGNVFGQKEMEKELEQLKRKYTELQSEYTELQSEYEGLELRYQSQIESMGKQESNQEDVVITNVIEDNNMITLYDLDFFTQNKMKEVTYIKDVFGEEYTHAYRIGTTATGDKYIFEYVTEFFLDKQYSKFSCKVFFPEDAYENEVHQLLIWGDEKQLGVVTVEKKSGLQSIELDVGDVDYLQFAAVTEGHRSGSALGIIEPYLEK